MVSDTYDSGSERWFYLAMVQLGPVDFLKERVSQDGMLTALTWAAQAHGGVLGHELRGGERQSIIQSHTVRLSQDSRHQPWQRRWCEASWLILLNQLNFPSEAAQPLWIIPSRRSCSCIFLAFPTSISDVATKIKPKGPVFFPVNTTYFFSPFKEKKLYKTVCLSPALQLRTAGSLWMGLLFGTAVPFFWATWPAGQDSRSLTRPRREERESLFWCSGWRSRKGEKLKVLCSGSRKNKVGHFYLCNKDIIVLTEEFFPSRCSLLSCSSILKCFMTETLATQTRIGMHCHTFKDCACVYPSSVFISIGQLPHNWPPIKMFWANSPFTKWSIQAFWSFPDQRPV